jgi:uncharacterized NAD(P)/FAD-binding protein YdhS
MHTAKDNGPTIGVIGGGFTGAIFAVHLARAASIPLKIDIIEPRDSVGAGLAYGSCGPEHRINVPSDRMFVFAEDRLHFSRWLKRTGRWQADPEALTTAGHHYSARQDFAAYMADLVAQTVSDNPSGSTIRHVKRVAIQVMLVAGTWLVGFKGGGTALYDHLVVCATHGAPPCRWPLVDGASELPGLVRDPWRPDALAAVSREASVLVIGTGLTMCDAVVTLKRHGHRGPIHAISRRALTSRPQGAFIEDFDLFRGEQPPDTAIGLLLLVRKRIRDAAEANMPWHAVIDSVRRNLPNIWPALPMSERAKITRHLRAYWDVHRFRMAPQVQRVMAEGLSEGWLRLSAGRIDEIGRSGHKFCVRWTPRRAAPQAELADAIINCTGPDSNPATSSNPVIRSLLEDGLIRPDPLRIGLDVDVDGRLLSRDGTANDGLRAAGPLARILVGEATGIPEASAHARHVAHALATMLRGAYSCIDPSSGGSSKGLPIRP